IMHFLSVRCLNCHNLDTFPRLSYDQVPFCSQAHPPELLQLCASTNSLVPEGPLSGPTPTSTPTPAPPPPPQMSSADDDFVALFNRNLFFSHPPAASPPTPPLTSPVAATFSISRHYHHSSHPAVQSYYHHQQQVKSSDREYAEYLMSSDLSSPNSLNELEIALAHEIISPVEYQRSLESYTHRSQLEENARRHQVLMGSSGGGGAVALSENCSAMEMLAAAKRSSNNNVPSRSEWCNDYYGGDMGYEDEDEMAPCAVYTGASGCRLAPFDY
ncbi:hypothetical protein BZA05DRAFT_331436, partial [Tricharina praecox]|uniref:uncharacterized protein n=1 Tax=Tricharina praecox TaxID=43433 RepID=UPI00221ED826